MEKALKPRQILRYDAGASRPVADFQSLELRTGPTSNRWNRRKSMTKLYTRLIRAALVLGSGAALRAAEYYVAPAGSDDAAGTIDAPFATVQRAQKATAPGDTVFIRGGVYRMTEAQMARRRGVFTAITFLDKSGLPGKRITYRAYPNERPVFDCLAVKPPGVRIDAFHVTGSWLHLEGLEVTGVQVTAQRHTQSICFENDGSHNIYERLAMHDGQAIGIYSVNGSDNLFLNCDAWNNWDYTSEGGKGGNVDGFGCHPSHGATNNVLRGCRAWFNSDDGFDCINAHEAVTFEGCWAFYNGLSRRFEPLADGNGFKAGGYGSTPVDRMPDTIPRHVIRNCVAVGNRSSGFYANHHPGGCDWLNNTAFRNGSNFNLQGRLADNVTEIDGCGHVLRNNLSHRSHALLSRIDRAKCTLENNSFDGELRLTDKDFASLDESALSAPRARDGSLPVSRFLRPVPGSVAAKKGMGAFVP